MSIKVVVDYSAVEKMFPVMESVADGKVPEEQVVSDLLTTPGMEVWLRHARKHGGLTIDRYKQIIAEAAEADKATDNYLVDFLWKNSRRVEECRRVLDRMKSLDFIKLCQQAAQEASKHLTVPFAGQVGVYLMCATRGSAIVLDNYMVIDIADYKDEPVEIRTLNSLLSHEIFHMGRRQYLDSLELTIDQSMDNPVYLLPGFLLEEGAATYLFSEDWMKEHPQAGPLYQASLEKLPEIAAWLNQTLLGPVQEIDKQKLGSFLNIEGYALGTELLKAIDLSLGRQALMTCLADPAIFFQQANVAITKGVIDIPPFSPQVVDLVNKQWSQAGAK